jgi:hypothetical protein
MRVLFLLAAFGAYLSGTVAIVNGPAGRLNVVEHGAGGVPVLFIHSLAGKCPTAEAQVDYAGRSRRAIAIDLRGHGQSEFREAAGLRPVDYADDIRAVLDALTVRHATLVDTFLNDRALAACSSRRNLSDTSSPLSSCAHRKTSRDLPQRKRGRLANGLEASFLVLC